MAAEQVAEHVAEGLEEAAELTRQFDMGRIGFGVGGLAVGLIFGFYVGHKFNKAKIRAEALKDAEIEIDRVRLFYHEKYESAAPKPPLEDLMNQSVIHPPIEERPTKPPVPVVEPTREVQYPKRRGPIKVPLDDWDYNKELAQRDRNHPYIIHQNEFNESIPGYNQVTWTYYEGDDILTDEHEQIVTALDLTVGAANLDQFGHGTDDENVLFVRNDRLEIEFEICRTPKSHAEEVLGIEPDDETDNSERP